MCGIFGYIDLQKFFNDDLVEKLKALTDLVHYRGPDGRNFLTLNYQAGIRKNSLESNVFLGHRRLAIIDLSDAGLQPMMDGDVYIVFNGEIFNYIELRNELKAYGQTFRTDTDTEIILKLYRQYGQSGFDRLNGMWAFALVDCATQQLILSRDRFSIKPLYYTRIGQVFAFSSEIKQLIPLLPSVTPNHSTLRTFIAQGLLDFSEETMFQSVQMVRPRNNFVLDLKTGLEKTTEYWNYAPANTLSVEDAIEKFRELFIDSIRIRLRSDVKVGALVSGGLDSSAIACVATYVLGTELETFSVVSNEEKYSEGRFVSILAEAGIKNTTLSFDGNEALRRCDEVIWHNDEPVCGFSAVAHYLMVEKIKKETDIIVLLSGQGGDECLCGYRKYYFFYILELLRRGRLIEALSLYAESWRQKTVVRQFSLGEAKRYLPKLANRAEHGFLLGDPVAENVGMRKTLRERQMLDLEVYSVPVLAHYEDRNSMAHSREIRLPFLDHRLVDLCVNLSPTLKIAKGWTKYILRQAIGELPDAIRWRRDKEGFLNPEERWLRDELRPTIEHLFENSRLAEAGIIDARRFMSYYKRFAAGDRGIWYGNINRVLFAEKWMRTFFS